MIVYFIRKYSDLKINGDLDMASMNDIESNLLIILYQNRLSNSWWFYLKVCH